MLALKQQAKGLELSKDLEPQIEAIKSERSLLNRTTDFVAPLIQQLEQALMVELEQAQQKLSQVIANETQQLEASADWQAIPEEERNRISQTLKLHVKAPSAEPVNHSALLDVLQQRSLASRAELAESLPTRFARARTAAAKALEPNTTAVKISSGVLKDSAALDAWWAAERQKLQQDLQDGPIQIN